MLLAAFFLAGILGSLVMIVVGLIVWALGAFLLFTLPILLGIHGLSVLRSLAKSEQKKTFLSNISFGDGDGILILTAIGFFWIGFHGGFSKPFPLPDLVLLLNIVVWTPALGYWLYRTVSFIIRLVHYYQLPDLAKAHTKPDGSLDLDAMRMDAPEVEKVLRDQAWVIDNHARRAALAFSDLLGRSGDVASGVGATRPTYSGSSGSRMEAATRFLRNYARYVRKANDMETDRLVEERLREAGISR